MTVLFDYIKNHATTDSSLMNLYEDLLKVFETNVLPSYATGHVQFTMFYMCSLSCKIQEKFMDYLWKQFISPNCPSILRQTAIAYIASLIARAKFIGKGNRFFFCYHQIKANQAKNILDHLFLVN